MAIEGCRIGGVRRLGDVTIELRPLSVMIGPNGSGKSSVLDALSLVAASARGRLAERVGELGGFSSFPTRRTPRRVEVELSFQGPGQDGGDYRLALDAAGAGYTVSSEILTRRGDASRPPLDLLHYSHGTLLYSGEAPQTYDSVSASQVAESFLSRRPSLSPWQERLGSVLYHCTPDVGTGSPIRLPQKLQPAVSPGADGASLASLLYRIRDSSTARFEFLEDTLKVAFPGFQRLEFPPVGGGLLALAWRDTNYSEPFFASDLSDGQLRFLAIVALLNTPEPPSLLLIDEPEDSLHPELLSLLVDLLREASFRTQVLVATHADRLVRFLKPEEVLVIDLDESGMAQFTPASSLDLEDWLEDYSLDQLWSKGRLGGRA